MNTFKKYFAAYMIVSLLAWECVPLLSVHAVDNNSVSTQQTNITEPYEVNWGNVDWTGEIVLLEDKEEYERQVKELEYQQNNKALKSLEPVTHAMTSEEVLEYYNVPEDIREEVRAYRDKTGEYLKLVETDALALLKEKMQFYTNNKSLFGYNKTAKNVGIEEKTDRPVIQNGGN